MRTAILKAVRANKPAVLSHPGTFDAGPAEATAATFAASAALSKSKTVLHQAGDSLAELIQQLHPEVAKLYVHPEVESRFSELSSLPDRQVVELGTTPQALGAIQLAILPARCGVAENGACWLDETCTPHRALPFSTEHLMLVVAREHLLATMHDAYAKHRTDGFGVFIAGPSKTADIEQSLVIGAQGPRSLVVVLV